MNQKIQLTVIILAKNEAMNLPRCLTALHNIDQRIVIDDFSVDRTVETARAYGAEVYFHKFDTFADQRNWAMNNLNIHHPWILHLDADEVVTSQLLDEIEQKTLSAPSNVSGFLMAFKTIFEGRWLKYSSTFPVWILRLIRHGFVKYIPSGHGEEFECHGKIERMNEPFLHYNFSKGLFDWFAKHNYYSSKEAAAICNSDHALDWHELFSSDPIRRRKAMKYIFHHLPAKPWVKFCYMYFWRMGFRDGLPGLTYCTLQAIYEYMVCLKVKEEHNRHQLLLKSSSEHCLDIEKL